MKKVILVTLWDQKNIGNRLQHYAMQRALEKLGLEVTNIFCRKKEDTDSLNYRWKKPIRKMLASVGVRRFQHNLYIENLDAERKEWFTRFSCRFLKKRIPVEYEGLGNIDWNTYDYAITGSDQVWHNWEHKAGELEFYYLTFMPKEKRIAYAPSFGFSEFPSDDLEVHRKCLAEMQRLSCRETSGARLIKDVTGREVPVVVDPTLLVHSDEWEEIAEKPSCFIPEQYMLVYFLGEKTSEYTAAYEDISKKNNLKIVDILTREEPDYYKTGPAEFVWLIKNAEYICTDSFHACVFSIIFHKQFTVFQRNGEGFEDMFDRIEDLLCDIGLSCNIYGKEEMFQRDWNRVDRIIREKVKESQKFLAESLA